jgi:tripartite-type tricarboxylate transporter receptor subunit TctC
MTSLTRRVVLTGLSAFAAAPTLGQATWPNRPITLLIGFPPGGPTDVVMRIVAQGLSMRLGQPVVVMNKPGATGTLAAAQVARAEPDGYTLLAIPATYAASAALFRTLPFRPVDDFTPVSIAVEFPYVFTTYAEHSVQTIPDLISAARASNTPLTYGTSGVGSLQHLAVEQFAKITNIKLQHIPFRGGAAAITDLLGNRIDFVAEPPASLLEFIRDGRLRAVAVTSAKRFFSLPNVPTVSESGLPGYDVTGWQGVLGPAKLPDSVMRRLHGALSNTLADQTIIDRLRAVGSDPKAIPPEEFKSLLASEIETWSKVIAAANVERI